MPATPEWMSVAEFADHMGVSRTAVYKALELGRIQLVRGRLNVAEAKAAWDATSRPSIGSSPPAAAETGPNYHRARAVREHIRARREQLELDELLGRKIEADEVRLAQFEHGKRTRDLFMALAGPLSAKGAGKSRRELEQILASEFRKAFEQLARTPLERPADVAATGTAS